MSVVATATNLARQLAIVSAIARATGARFASFLHVNRHKELAQHTVIIGVKTEDLYKRDIAAMLEMVNEIRIARETGAETWNGLAIDTALDAIATIHQSRATSLKVGVGNHPDYRCRGVYQTWTDLPWIKLHKRTGHFHVSALRHQKHVLIPGQYTDGGSLWTPREAIERRLPSGRFRQFGTLNILGARINGETIELATDVTAP